MTKVAFAVITMLAVALSQTLPAAQSTAEIEKRLASAQHKATVDGDLTGAIETTSRSSRAPAPIAGSRPRRWCDWPPVISSSATRRRAAPTSGSCASFRNRPSRSPPPVCA